MNGILAIRIAFERTSRCEDVIIEDIPRSTRLCLIYIYMLGRLEYSELFIIYMYFNYFFFQSSFFSQIRIHPRLGD